MNAPRLHILLRLVLVCGLTAAGFRIGQQVVRAQELSPPEAMSPEAAIDVQLRINRTTLLEGKSDKDRIDVATLLLLNDKPAAREIVLDVLRRTDTPQARAAVCEALNLARVKQTPLQQPEDFIKPLIAILTSVDDSLLAKPAAEATLMFGYSQVQPDLEKAVTDPALSVNVRMNIIYALRRHPDTQAVAKLVSLVESPELPIAEAAQNALAAVGIAVSPDPAARRQMLAELTQRGAGVFLRNRLAHQENRVRELETDLAAWQKRFLTALTGQYDSVADENARSVFLTQQLTSPESIVRSWALDKLQELRKGTGKLKLSELEPTLLNLIPDQSRQVRLRTARLLALMGELNVAKPLLAQLKVEPDEQVRREILVALREACYVGSLAATGRKVPDEVRKETLEWAVAFLRGTDAEKVRIGAEVIGKLLEQDGFKPEDVERYLKSLSDRYSQVNGGTEPAVRAYLLNAMAGLCVQRSTCREQAIKSYNGLFEQALADKVEVVRQSAVHGLVNIDKHGALRKLRETMTSDSSPTIRQELIDLAGEVGGAQDLDWLAEKLGVPGDEGQRSWQATVKIFQRLDVAILAGWAAKVESLGAAGKIAVEQRIAYCKLLEQRAQSENRTDLLKGAQTSLAKLYLDGNNLKLASESLRTLLVLATTEDERQWAQGQLLGVYLGLADVEQARELVYKCLQEKNLDLEKGFLVKTIDEHLNSPATADPNAVIAALRQIKPPMRDAQAVRAWEALLSRWSEAFAKAKKGEESYRVN
ncbi:MAG: HEAT repeat domain-containing protein [Planctomycetes bacterium]|nr:HEAT repeat domain-containing protein [Planctomycetota bacterium]